MANYTRYSPADWSSSNMSHYNSADNARNNSERIRWERCQITSMVIYSVSSGPIQFCATWFLPYMMTYSKSEWFYGISTSVDLF